MSLGQTEEQDPRPFTTNSLSNQSCKDPARAIFLINSFSPSSHCFAITYHTKVNISVDEINIWCIRIMVRPDERIISSYIASISNLQIGIGKKRNKIIHWLILKKMTVWDRSILKCVFPFHRPTTSIDQQRLLASY